MRLLSRVAHACIEGSVFVYTSPGKFRSAAPLLAATRQHPDYLSPCADKALPGSSAQNVTCASKRLAAVSLRASH